MNDGDKVEAQSPYLHRHKPLGDSRVAVRTAFSPSESWGTPSSQPLMTWPTPMVHWKGEPRSRDESNLEPSVRVPTSSGQLPQGL